MILYTTVPYDQIYPVESDVFTKRTVMMVGSVPVLCEQTDAQSWKIVQVISSDPQHFLDESCQPGTKISFANTGGLSTI